MISSMGAPRGRQQRGKSAQFEPDRAVRASVLLQPQEPLRRKFEDLVNATGASGAEVVRFALAALQVGEGGRPMGWPEDHTEEAVAS